MLLTLEAEHCEDVVHLDVLELLKHLELLGGEIRDFVQVNFAERLCDLERLPRGEHGDMVVDLLEGNGAW